MLLWLITHCNACLMSTCFGVSMLWFFVLLFWCFDGVWSYTRRSLQATNTTSTTGSLRPCCHWWWLCCCLLRLLHPLSPHSCIFIIGTENCILLSSSHSEAIFLLLDLRPLTPMPCWPDLRSNQRRVPMIKQDQIDNEKKKKQWESHNKYKLKKWRQTPNTTITTTTTKKDFCCDICVITSKLHW